jgi:hypothetical protein
MSQRRCMAGNRGHYNEEAAAVAAIAITQEDKKTEEADEEEEEILCGHPVSQEGSRRLWLQSLVGGSGKGLERGGRVRWRWSTALVGCRA